MPFFFAILLWHYMLAAAVTGQRRERKERES